tara:strand:- start:61 stop:498 length:438 start_codon:yes stop_codon:yes gene_type:complete
MKAKGLWLFGYSGSGKTFLSKKFNKKIKNSFIIDGDIVRKFLSTDLKYTKQDRIKQNKRVLGLALITIYNKKFPIISSVYLDPSIAKKCKNYKIKILRVIRKSDILNKKLKNQKFVVGKNIKQPKINCEMYLNNKKKINLKNFDL